MHVTCGSGSSSSSSSSGGSVGRFLEKQPLSLFVPWATYYFLSTASAAVAAALMMVRSVVVSCVCRRSFIGGMDQVVMILLSLVACQSVRLGSGLVAG